jgi:small ligand-binding sensory domain FIST
MRALWEQSSSEDREKLSTSLLIGIAMSPGEQHYQDGDFRLRDVIGFDAQSGALALGDQVEPKIVVQFHLRDAQVSAADIESKLRNFVSDREPSPAGAMLLSCRGRGRELYGAADHDSRAFGRIVGAAPLAGFFATGEIGPVHETTHVHSYTSLFGMISPKNRN